MDSSSYVNLDQRRSQDLFQYFSLAWNRIYANVFVKNASKMLGLGTIFICLSKHLLQRINLHCNDLLPEASFSLRVLLPASVCVCVCHSIACPRDNTDPFQLGAPNLEQRCKTHWLRFLLFFGIINRDLQAQVYLENPNLPHFELVRTITQHSFNLDHQTRGAKYLGLDPYCFDGQLTFTFKVKFDLKSGFRFHHY